MIKDYSCQRDVKITVKVGREIRQINISKIICIKCDSYVSTIHLIEDEHISTTKLLKYYEIELSEYSFIRVNKNCLVDLKHIESIELCEKGKIILASNQSMSISRRYLLKMKEKMKN